MKNYLYFLLAALGLFVILTSGINYSTGSPGGKTGSPGDGGHTCTDCHGGTASPQEGWITSTIPADGYIPGQTYTITATGTHVGVTKFGFEVTSENANAQKVGTLIVTNSNQNQLANNNKSITHKSSGTTPSGNSKTWSFDWTAPAEGTGDVTFYGAFNAANGNGNTSGDVIYKSTLAVTEAATALTGLNVQLTGMTPHIGQLFEARLIDKATQMEIERLRIDQIPAADFDIMFANAIDGHSYWVDFYADMNDNGYYDGIPTDHAWRITFNNFTDGTLQTFTHNTNFNEINWKHMYEIEFSGMTPHIGQKLEVRLTDQNSLKEAGRVTIAAIPAAEFSVFLPYLVTGVDYTVDLYADFNQNGVYDAPPTDHAWQFELTNVEGDEDDNFIHNTNFTDIGWNYRFTLNAMEMNPHLGELFELRVVNQSSLAEVGRVSIDSISLVNFSTMALGLQIGEDYYIDFYADHNGNGQYDAPPVDHAWRLELSNVAGDSQLDFTHNTNFTDIEWPLTSIAENNISASINLYPNPANEYIHVDLTQLEMNVVSMQIINASGSIIKSTDFTGNTTNRIDIGDLHSGLYYMIIELENGSITSKRVIKL
ncbi:MAG: choice-of-anchor V domain-containing protein [Bacteroidales bacterium]